MVTEFGDFIYHTEVYA